MKDKTFKIGIVGTGFIARGLILALSNYQNLEVSYVLTRRPLDSLNNTIIDPRRLTHDVQKLIDNSDLVVEATGDVVHGTEIAAEILKAGIPMVTMNSELQIVTGTMLSRLGTFVEAEGDQPGSLGTLDYDVRAMGFKPIVYGNIKRYLNLNPAKDEMEYWSKRQGISLDQVTAFTDGTKVQIEQALVANALGGTIACRNLTGIACKDVEDGARRLGEIATEIGKPTCDYVLCPTGPAGVFIVATHDNAQQPYLEYLKLGTGPYYVIIQPYHLCHLEIPKTILHVLYGNTPTYKFNNGQKPTVQVAAVAKRQIGIGETVKRGLGSFDVRGEAVRIKDVPHAVPIGLIHEAEFIKAVPEGHIVTFADVKLPKTLALEMWQQVLDEVQINNTKTQSVLIS
jgi:predicted homoserine dehydrogenase-like protein